MFIINRLILFSMIFLLSYACFAFGQNLAEFEKRVTAFTLENGMKFLLVERHEAPVVSFFTLADVGAANETKGITGLAHLFEHMAFKGTTTIGTKDLVKEREAMRKEDEAFRKLKAELAKGQKAEKETVEALTNELEEAKKDAQQFVVNNELAEAIEESGGVGLNAFTSYDFTGYTSSLPSNKIELWFSIESDRFLNPLLREFYTEKNVVMEERRMGIENRPVGKLFEEFNGVAFLAHPYGEPLIGHMSDLKALSREKAEQFFQKYYMASNLLVVIAGDVEPAKVKALAQTYFGRLPLRAKPEPVVTEEPPQKGERRVTLELPSQPYLVIGFHKPDFNDENEVKFDVLTDILSGGQSSRMYQKLVKDLKIAIRVGLSSNYPGIRYPNLFVAYALPSQGHTAQECEKIILEELEKLKTEHVTAAELDKAKTRARAELVRSLESNESLAINLAYYELMAGDWREMFYRSGEKINAVTATDIQNLAKKFFTHENRSVGVIKTAAKIENK